MESIVRLEALTKRYGKKEALHGLTLDIAPGELFCLLGPNGAGKTTTLKMLVGLLKPTSGTITIGGRDMVKDPRHAKALIGFVPDVPYIYEKLTPWELLRFIGKLYDMDPKAIESQGNDLIRFFDLWEVRDTLIDEFSHGMRQKAVLAASLLHRPRVFILDEPMVGLDPVSIRSFKDFMRVKLKEGMTILFSTHTLSTAEELADRIGVLHHGRLIALGSMQELREKYRSQDNLEQMFIRMVRDEKVGS